MPMAANRILRVWFTTARSLEARLAGLGAPEFSNNIDGSMYIPYLLPSPKRVEHESIQI